VRALTDSPADFKLMGSKVPQNVKMPALDADEPPTAVQNLMLIALSSAQKSVTVQTKNIMKNSSRYIHALPVDNKMRKRCS